MSALALDCHCHPLPLHNTHFQKHTHTHTNTQKHTQKRILPTHIRSTGVPLSCVPLHSTCRSLPVHTWVQACISTSKIRQELSAVLTSLPCLKAHPMHNNPLRPLSHRQATLTTPWLRPFTLPALWHCRTHEVRRILIVGGWLSNKAKHSILLDALASPIHSASPVALPHTHEVRRLCDCNHAVLRQSMSFSLDMRLKCLRFHTQQRVHTLISMPCHCLTFLKHVVM